MKIAVKLTIDIPDPSQWLLAFGTVNPAEIRAEVKQYIGEGIAQMGVFGTGEVKAEVDWS